MARVGAAARRRLAAAALLVLAAASARAGMFGRSKMDSLWTEKSIPINGDEDGWDEKTAFEQDGLSVFARNDGTNLYLLITGHARETRDMLNGESRQDLALWFVAADGKTRRWGMRIPYTHRAPLTNALRDPAGLDPEPELINYLGAAISTATLPEDIIDRLTAVGRRPIWELEIPLKRVELNPDGALAMDFLISAPQGGPKHRAAPAAARTESPADGGEGSAAPHGRGGGKHGDAGSHPEEFVWDALSYTLSIRLARDPALAR